MSLASCFSVVKRNLTWHGMTWSPSSFLILGIPWGQRLLTGQQEMNHIRVGTSSRLVPARACCTSLPRRAAKPRKVMKRRYIQRRLSNFSSSNSQVPTTCSRGCFQVPAPEIQHGYWWSGLHHTRKCISNYKWIVGFLSQVLGVSNLGCTLNAEVHTWNKVHYSTFFKFKSIHSMDMSLHSTSRRWHLANCSCSPQQSRCAAGMSQATNQTMQQHQYLKQFLKLKR